ncbi:hypothetical protein GCM10020331_103250 [Ectobacillus funiculus]
MTGVEAELRVGATLRNQLVEEQGAVRNKLIRWLDRYFPEFTQVFPTFGKTALAALACTPFPCDVIAKTTEEILNLYRQVEGVKFPQRPKVIKIGTGSSHLNWRDRRTGGWPVLRLPHLFAVIAN